MSTQTVVDDRDTSALTYDGDWRAFVDPSDSSKTMHGTKQPGASVTLSFMGTALQVKGMVFNPNISTHYTLDGSNSTQPLSSGQQLNKHVSTFFSLDEIPCSNHTITFVNVEGQTMGINSFIFTPCLFSQNASLTETAESSSSINTGPGSNDSGGQALHRTTRKMSTPLIIGIVVGGVGLISVIAIFVFLAKRWNKQRRKRSTPSEAYLASLKSGADTLYSTPSGSSSRLYPSAAVPNDVKAKVGYNFSEPFFNEKDERNFRQPSPAVEYLPAYVPSASQAA